MVYFCTGAANINMAGCCVQPMNAAVQQHLVMKYGPRVIGLLCLGVLIVCGVFAREKREGNTRCLATCHDFRTSSVPNE